MKNQDEFWLRSVIYFVDFFLILLSVFIQKPAGFCISEFRKISHFRIGGHKEISTFLRNLISIMDFSSDIAFSARFRSFLIIIGQIA